MKRGRYVTSWLFIAVVCLAFSWLAMQRYAESQWLKHKAVGYRVRAVVGRQLDASQPGELRSIVVAEVSELGYSVDPIDGGLTSRGRNEWYILVEIYDSSSARIWVSSPSRQGPLWIQDGQTMDGPQVPQVTSDPIDTITILRD